MSDDEFLKMLGEVRTMLMNYARMSTGNLFDAEDLYMATVSKAYENRARFIDGTNFACWSRTIMRNTFLNDCKRKSLSQTIFIEADTSDVRTPLFDRYTQAAAEQALYAEEIKKAVRLLPSKYRIVFRMYLAGYSYAQIAQQQGITLDTVKSRIHAARKILQKQLKEYGFY